MKNNAIKIFAILLVIAAVAALGFMGYSMANIIAAEEPGNQAREEVTGEAPEDTFEGFESFTVGESAFDIGMNVYGKVIFVDNAAALKAAKEKCALAIEEIRSQAPELGSFQARNIYSYYNYIWQINWDAVDQDLNLQRQFLNKFLEYYVNGDPKQDVN
jgi:hypothetical protein